MKIFDSFISFYYEMLSKFVPKKVFYETKGSCLKCGKCCRYIYCAGLSCEFEFKILQLIYKDYRNFKIIGHDKDNNYVLRCKHITRENKCPIYNDRPQICKNYPKKRISLKVNLHNNCGYFVEPEKSFKDFL